jgi:hypothetical protein
MQVVIPTYQRAALLQRDTLAYLERSNVDPGTCLILVASEDESREYASKLAGEWSKRIVVTAPGLRHARNFARHHILTQGSDVVWMDDDVSSIRVRLNDYETAEVKLSEVANPGFELARSAGAHLWGIYPTVNPYYMKAKTRVGLWHCVGCFYGEIIERAPELDIQYGDAKEDYERCLRWWERDGYVVRMDWFAPKTAYYREAGGIQGRTPATVDENIRLLQDRWPGRVRRNAKRKSAYPEILLVNPKARKGVSV